MGKKTEMFLGLLMFAAFTGLLSGCGANPMEAEYEAIKDSGLTGEALLKNLTEFELRNMGHFNSKIDLGAYYLLSGDIDRAWDYFRRAEAVVKKAPDDEYTRKNTAIMYGSLARVHAIQGEYDTALAYAEKAAQGDDEEALPYTVPYRYLQGHILLEKGENEKALEVFDPLFRSHSGAAVPDDIRAYMYLLATAGPSAGDRSSDGSPPGHLPEAAAMVDLFFEKGSYFPGLGLFASSVYEAAGQAEKAVYAAFLDFEYQSSYRETDMVAFLKNIDTLEKQLASQDRLAPAAKALSLVRSFYDPAAEAAMGEQYEPSFFAGEYIILRKKIQAAVNTTGAAINTPSAAINTIGAASLTTEEFNRYLGMEHYFSNFPGYYWNIWQATASLSESSRANFLPVLERIIALDREGIYAQRAWDEISKILGFGGT